MADLSIIVLAAGQGTRMNADHPKVLIKLNSQTLIQNLLENIKQAGYSDSVSIVVGFQGQEVINLLGSKYNYVWQKEQLGTGHAVQQCQKFLQGKFKDHLILYGDVPFISAQTIQKIINLHQQEESALSMLTFKISNFKDNYQSYYHFGRIIRDQQEEVIKIVEFKDASEEEKKIRELNPAIYCVQDQWLWENLKKLNKQNQQAEYYLTDLIKLASEQGLKINSLVIEDGFEFMGVNTLEDLELAQKICKELGK